MLELLYILLTTLTGIDRQVDPQLEAHAQRRVIEIQSDFSHQGIPAGWGEVLGWNRGATDPVESIVLGWRASPGHWAILSDPGYTRIGCAISQTDRYWFVCMSAVPALRADVPETPPATVGPASTAPPMMPNTSTGESMDLLNEQLVLAALTLYYTRQSAYFTLLVEREWPKRLYTPIAAIVTTLGMTLFGLLFIFNGLRII